jgi:tripartite-type tricarboxylate transporter receptor subunit TctC
MTRTLSRRRLLQAAGSAALAAVPSAWAQGSWPSRPLRLICPWTAGGSTDVILRTMGQVVGRTLGQTVVVENKPGASGILGAVDIARAGVDGHTITQVPFGVFAMPHMQKVTLQPLRDLAYVANLSAYTNGLVVRADSPITSIQQLVAQAKQAPDTVTYGCAGLGTFAHLSTEEFAFRAGIKLRTIPYKGDADGLQALLGGQVMTLSSSTSWASQVDSGACRLLALYGRKRLARWASSPTLFELGFDTIPESPFGLAMARGTDTAIVTAVQDAFRTALEDPSVVAVLAKYDMPAQFMNSAEFTRFAQVSFDNYRAMISRLGLGVT